MLGFPFEHFNVCVSFIEPYIVGRGGSAATREAGRVMSDCVVLHDCSVFFVLLNVLIVVSTF